jgi:hypothetical protein
MTEEGSTVASTAKTSWQRFRKHLRASSMMSVTPDAAVCSQSTSASEHRGMRELKFAFGVADTVMKIRFSI